jgi:hypothetical protein
MYNIWQGNLQTVPMPWASDPFSSAGDIVDLFPLPLESSNPTTNPNTVCYVKLQKAHKQDK